MAGDFTPFYLWHPEAAERIHRKVPEAKIIAILRDPVERAYSHYLNDVREGLQAKVFLEVLQLEHAEKSEFYDVGRQYISLGCYGSQVGRYLDRFDAHQVLVLLFDDLASDPLAVLEQIADFLEIDRMLLDGIDVSRINNRASRPKNSLVRSLLQSSVGRRAYRRLVPDRLRAYVRENLLFSPVEKGAIDPSAVSMLAGIYAPDLERLEFMLNRSLPQLRDGW